LYLNFKKSKAMYFEDKFSNFNCSYCVGIKWSELQQTKQWKFLHGIMKTTRGRETVNRNFFRHCTIIEQCSFTKLEKSAPIKTFPSILTKNIFSNVAHFCQMRIKPFLKELLQERRRFHLMCYYILLFTNVPAPLLNLFLP